MISIFEFQIYISNSDYDIFEFILLAIIYIYLTWLHLFNFFSMLIHQKLQSFIEENSTSNVTFQHVVKSDHIAEDGIWNLHKQKLWNNCHWNCMPCYSTAMARFFFLALFICFFQFILTRFLFFFNENVNIFV